MAHGLLVDFGAGGSWWDLDRWEDCSEERKRCSFTCIIRTTLRMSMFFFWHCTLLISLSFTTPFYNSKFLTMMTFLRTRQN